MIQHVKTIIRQASCAVHSRSSCRVVSGGKRCYWLRIIGFRRRRSCQQLPCFLTWWIDLCATKSSDHPDFRIVIDHAFNQPRRLGWLKAWTLTITARRCEIRSRQLGRVSTSRAAGLVRHVPGSWAPPNRPRRLDRGPSSGSFLKKKDPMQYF